VNRPSFADPEVLRELLVRLHRGGPDAWRHDPEAAELMRYTGEKYAPLARRHNLEPADAAVAAFEVMRARAARQADDPWAVVTRAVQVTLIAEERATGLLCSPSRARRAELAGHHDATRFGDHEMTLSDWHPAFQVAPAQDDVELDVLTDHAGAAAADPNKSTSTQEAIRVTVGIFAALGWPADAASMGVEYICSRLVDAGNRTTAHELLRRDPVPLALLDLDQAAWLAMLRVVLGDHGTQRIHTTPGRGLLLRLLVGEHPAELFDDDDLVRSIASHAPEPAWSAP
jgi:hypothetical protein